MAEFTRYPTKQGDRWDLIAWKAYGDVTKMREVIEANPDIALVAVFDEGYSLILPIIPEVSTQNSQLPPWKRDSATNQSTTETFLLTERADASPVKAGGGADLENDFFDYYMDLPIDS